MGSLCLIDAPFDRVEGFLGWALPVRVSPSTGGSRLRSTAARRRRSKAKAAPPLLVLLLKRGFGCASPYSRRVLFYSRIDYYSLSFLQDFTFPRKD
ncbi:hypothetical protein IQ238_15060 [Pleurocapsales cyanobacterium LEGE 06147]|nr:hypothetical protein [Pleurocapsales cyanobacterium LEGE 06147]